MPITSGLKYLYLDVDGSWLSTIKEDGCVTVQPGGYIALCVHEPWRRSGGSEPEASWRKPHCIVFHAASLFISGNILTYDDSYQWVYASGSISLEYSIRIIEYATAVRGGELDSERWIPDFEEMKITNDTFLAWMSVVGIVGRKVRSASDEREQHETDSWSNYFCRGGDGASITNASQVVPLVPVAWGEDGGTVFKCPKCRNDSIFKNGFECLNCNAPCGYRTQDFLFTVTYEWSDSSIWRNMAQYSQEFFVLGRFSPQDSPRHSQDSEP